MESAHDEQHGQTDAPPQLGETLQWETPRPKRKSFLGRLVAGATTSTTAAPKTTTATEPRDARDTTGSATAGPPPSYAADHTTPAMPAAAAAATTAFAKSSTEQKQPPPPARSSQTTGLKARLNAILPPHRTYLNGHLTRRSLLLFVILPLLILFLFVLPLAIGLGVGLSEKNNSASNVPLPPGLGSGTGGTGGTGSGDTNTSPGETYTGDLTYYSPGLGACGVVSDASDMIVSVSHILFDAASTSGNPNDNPLCGRKIRITRDQGGSRRRKRRRIGESGSGSVLEDVGRLERRSQVEVTVVDRCVGCQVTDLDLSLGAFTQLAEESEGRVEGTWSWV